MQGQGSGPGAHPEAQHLAVRLGSLGPVHSHLEHDAARFAPLSASQLEVVALGLWVEGQARGVPVALPPPLPNLRKLFGHHLPADRNVATSGTMTNSRLTGPGKRKAPDSLAMAQTDRNTRFRYCADLRSRHDGPFLAAHCAAELTYSSNPESNQQHDGPVPRPLLQS